MENKVQLELDVHDYDTETEGERSGKIPTQDFISVLRANSKTILGILLGILVIKKKIVLFNVLNFGYTSLRFFIFDIGILQFIAFVV